jgi:hypothetical protein
VKLAFLFVWKKPFNMKKLELRLFYGIGFLVGIGSHPPFKKVVRPLSLEKVLGMVDGLKEKCGNETKDRRTADRG